MIGSEAPLRLIRSLFLLSHAGSRAHPPVRSFSSSARMSGSWASSSRSSFARQRANDVPVATAAGVHGDAAAAHLRNSALEEDAPQAGKGDQASRASSHTTAPGDLDKQGDRLRK